MALSAAGTAASIAGQNRARNAANQMTQMELERQRQLQQQAESIYNTSKEQATYGEAQTGIKEGANKAQTGYENLQQVPLSFSQPSQRVGNSVVTARDAAQMNLSNRTRSALQGYDQWLLNRQIQQQQQGNLLGVVGNLAQSSERILPYELQSAAHAGDSLSGLGGLLSTGGSLLGGYTAMNGGWFTNPNPQPNAASPYLFHPQANESWAPIR